MNSIDVHIVSGPTCVGKSQFIETILQDYEQVRFAYQQNHQMCPGKRYVFHYNILRPFDASGKTRTKLNRRLISNWSNQFAPSVSYPYRTEEGLKRFLEIPSTKLQTTILVVPQRLLLARVSARRHMEPLTQDSLRPYPKTHWNDVFASVNIVSVYRSWIWFLTELGYPYKIIDSSNGEYRQIENEHQLIRLLER